MNLLKGFLIMIILLIYSNSSAQKKVELDSLSVNITNEELIDFYPNLEVVRLNNFENDSLFFTVSSNPKMFVVIDREGYIYENVANEFLIELREGSDIEIFSNTLISSGNFDIIESYPKLSMLLIRSKSLSIYTTSQVYPLIESSEVIMISLNPIIEMDPNIKGDIRILQDSKLKPSNIYQYSLDRRQWHFFNNSRSDGNYDIDGAEALALVSNNRNFKLKKQIIVGVLDSGIDNRPNMGNAFRGALWENSKEIKVNFFDDDKNGKVDDINGWNFALRSGDIVDVANNFHGTHVSGIIGARPNLKSRISGVFPHCKLLTCVVTNRQGQVVGNSLIGSLNYCVEMKVDIVNMSIGGLLAAKEKQLLHNALWKADRQGILLVASAGNDSLDLSQRDNYFPCQAQAPVICVGNTKPDDQLHSSSNYDNRYNDNRPGITISAPGTDIYSIIWGNNAQPYTGTSMAAPIVAGSLAMLKAVYPEETNNQLVQRLLETVDNKGQIAKMRYNAGRLNLSKALTYSKNNYCSDQRNRNFPFANSNEPGIDGSDLENKFYTICTMNQFRRIQNYNNKRFQLKADIAGNPNQVFTTSLVNGTFKGHLDGQGHKISNVKIKQTAGNVGVFSQLNKAGIQNLVIDNINIEGGDYQSGMGGLVGQANRSSFRNIMLSGKIQGSRAGNTGGVVGTAYNSNFTKVFFEGIVDGRYKVGGINGHAINTVFINSHFSGSAKGEIVGGISGFLKDNSQIVNSYAYNKDSKGKTAIGGLSGMSSCDCQINNSYTEGSIHADKPRFMGDIVGVSMFTKIERAYSILKSYPLQRGITGVRMRRNYTIDGKTYVDCKYTKGRKTKVLQSFFWLYSNLDGKNNGKGLTLSKLLTRSSYPQNWFENSWNLKPGYYPTNFDIPLGLSGKTIRGY